jgi:hypothetical protein
MSLEESILALARAVEENTAIMKFINQGGYRLSDPQAAYDAVKREHEASLCLRPEQQKDVAKHEAQAPNDKPKSPPTPDTSPASSNESEPVTYDDVKRITIKVSEVSRDKAKAALSRFGVASAKALKEEQWPEYVKYMTRVANGEVDPEASHE